MLRHTRGFRLSLQQPPWQTCMAGNSSTTGKNTIHSCMHSGNPHWSEGDPRAVWVVRARSVWSDVVLGSVRAWRGGRGAVGSRAGDPCAAAVRPLQRCASTQQRSNKLPGQLCVTFRGRGRAARALRRAGFNRHVFSMGFEIPKAHTRALAICMGRILAHTAQPGLQACRPPGGPRADPTCMRRLPGFARAVALVSCQRLHPQGEISVA
eukprot:358451-Chlamydomonas_euryale.AAC.1